MQVSGMSVCECEHECECECVRTSELQHYYSQLQYYRCTHTFDGEAVWLPSAPEKVAEDHLLPVAAVGDQPEVREGTLGRANLLLSSSQQVAWASTQGKGTYSL